MAGILIAKLATPVVSVDKGRNPDTGRVRTEEVLMKLTSNRK
jgi:hypothetical protein